MKTSKIQTTSFSLHIMAMIFMLIDHAGILLFPTVSLLRCIGRLAFPIFAFLAVEGFYHTKNLRKYLFRLFIWAVISEIPYNILKTGSIYDPTRRNVLWTLLFGIILIYVIDRIRKKYGDGFILLGSLLLSAIVCYGFARLVNADYGYAGLFTVLVFYLFRGKHLALRMCQIVCILFINTVLLGGVRLFPGQFFIPRQIFAVLALIPIFMYDGKKGYTSKFTRWLYYAFYPLHIIILAILRIIFK